MTTIKTTGFICKACGAQSPSGIGYAGQPTRSTPTPDCPNSHAVVFTVVGGDMGPDETFELTQGPHAVTLYGVDEDDDREHLETAGVSGIDLQVLADHIAFEIGRGHYPATYDLHTIASQI